MPLDGFRLRALDHHADDGFSTRCTKHDAAAIAERLFDGGDRRGHLRMPGGIESLGDAP